MQPPLELRTDRLVLRPTTDADLPSLHAILQQPGVARWWGIHADEASTREALFGDEDGFSWTIFEGDAVVGAIQAHEETTPDYRHAGIDLFLADAVQRRGLGPEAIRRVVEHLTVERGHHRIVIDPSVRNVAAIVAYERVGFRRIGVMRRYERRGGSWGDGLLLELVVPDPDRRARPPEASAAASTRLQLIPATGLDIPRILPMMRDFNRYEGIAIDETTLVPALEKLLGDPAIGTLWMIERAGGLIGYAALTFGFDLEWAGRDAWLTELWLVAEARGEGAGRAALAAVEIEAARLGVRALHLMVRHENVEARGLYESAGFRAPLRETLSKRLPPAASEK